MEARNRSKATFLVALVLAVLFVGLNASVFAKGPVVFGYPLEQMLETGAAFGAPNPAGKQPQHTGRDYHASSGTPVFAVADGTVSWAGWWPKGSQPNGHGETIWILHGFGSDSRPVYSVYAHLSRTEVTVGQTVTKGELIGISGETGFAKGAHLHFAIARKAPDKTLKWGDWDDPNDYLGRVVDLSQVTPNSSLPTWGWGLIAALAVILIIVLVIILVPGVKETTVEAAWRFVNWSLEQIGRLALKLADSGSRKSQGKSIRRKVHPVRLGIVCGIGLVAILCPCAFLSAMFANQEASAVAKSTVSVDLTSLPSFWMIYWDLIPVHFSCPDDVWLAAKSAGTVGGCDPLLIAAIAHSESSRFDRWAVSPASAKGRWQFIPSTWEEYRPWPEAEPTNDLAAAYAACKLVQDLKLEEQNTQQGFVARFTGSDGGRCWNQHTGQARYVWNLWNKLKEVVR